MGTMSEKINKNRQRNFREYVAQGLNPYRAAIEAGYSEKYAKTNSHKLLEKNEKEIEALKPIVQETLEKEFTYSVKESFNKLCEIQELAMLQNENGNYSNLSVAAKAEELKGKMYGVYEADNKQKAFNISVNREAVEVEGNSI